MIEVMSINLLEYSLLRTRQLAMSDILDNHNDNDNHSYNHTYNGSSSIIDGYDYNAQQQQQQQQQQLIHDYAMKKLSSHTVSSSHAFDHELSRRKLALLLYLIRSPIFDRYVIVGKGWMDGGMDGRDRWMDGRDGWMDVVDSLFEIVDEVVNNCYDYLHTFIHLLKYYFFYK